MKLEKCPICSTRMREQDGRMICQNCGYYQIIDKDASAPIPAQPLPQRQAEPVKYLVSSAGRYGFRIFQKQ